MRKSNQNFLFLPVVAALYSLALMVHKNTPKPDIVVSKQASSVNFNPDLFRFFSFGNKMLVSDIFWIKTLLEADMEHYKKNDLGNWMYYRFLTIAILDPLFYENYYFGGLYLSIVKDDPLGGSILYERGLKYYPNDYNLNYNAGFNYYFELGDASKGIPLLEKVKDHPRAPAFITSIINKLKLQSGVSLETVFGLVLDRYKKTEGGYLKNRLKDDLYAIRAEIDLGCLNGTGIDCATSDLLGDPYIRAADGKYTAKKKFDLYRLSKRKK